MTKRRSSRALWALLGLAWLAALGLASACGPGVSTSTPAPTPVPSPAFGLRSDAVASADHPSVLAFTPDGRLLIAEQFTGNIRVVAADGKLLPDLFAHIDVADWLHQDWGLTGLAVDPEFSANHYIYAFYTELQPSDANRPIGRSKLVRFTDNNGRAADEKTIIGDFPETRLDHQGFKANGSIHFGPDGYLYVTVGDYDYGKTRSPDDTLYAQDPSSPLGKVLRIDASTGDAAPGNPPAREPGADERIFASGFNRGADFAFHPQTKQVYGTDSTDSCEELNIVEAGKNYGWPNVGEFPFADCTAGTDVTGIYFLAKPNKKPGEFQSQVNVSGMAFVSAGRYPALGDSLLVCEGLTKQMQRLVLSPADASRVTSEDTVVYDCNRAITTAGDGTVYYGNDSQVRRLVPAQ